MVFRIVISALLVVPAFTATCGGGSRGDGICPNSSLCCSRFGWCGSTDEHCGSNPAPPTNPIPPPPPAAGTCGGGNRGNGVCSDSILCCSPFGWCGSSPAHCGSNPVPPTNPVPPPPPAAGTCGGGNRGNGVCPDQDLCCSPFGWCGSSPEHCGSNPVPPTNPVPPPPPAGGTCGGGNRGNGVCPDQGLCCSEFGWCGSSSAHCGSNRIPRPPRGPNPVPPPPPGGMIIGHWLKTWSPSTPPVDVNLSILFSGWANVDNALAESNSLMASISISGERYISFGGGNHNGHITAAALDGITRAIRDGRLNNYDGIAYDVEEGDSGLHSAFATSFATAKAAGKKVLVTVSHSAPYGISDAASLMDFFFSSTDIDYISPQLYTTGRETANDFAITNGFSWDRYTSSRAAIVPSIVYSNYFASAEQFFSQNHGIQSAGFIQWV